METWFLNHVLGLSLSVLLLGLPRSLGTGTPINSSTAPVTIRFYSAAPEELSNTENNGTSTSGFSESLSSSQRNLLLTHTADTHTATAGNLETEQTQTLIETSSRSLETTALSTEPLASTFVVATTEASSSSSSSSSSTSRGGSSSSSSSSSSSTSSGGSSSSSTSSTSSGGSSSSSSSGGNSSIGSSSTSSSSSGSSSISSSSTSSSSSGSSSISSSSTSSSSSGSSSISSSSTSSSSGSSSSSSSTSSSSSISSSGSSSSTSSSSSGNSSSSSSGSNSSTWENFPNTVHVTNTSHAVLWETRSSVFTDDSHLSQDSTGTTLGLEDATASVSQTAGLTHGEYASTTISRAGERTLLSVTSSSSNSTSPAFTEKSNSPPPLSTSDIRARTAETEGYTHSAPSTKTDSKDTTEQHMTRSSKGMSSETGSPGLSGGTQSLTGLPNATHPQYTSTFGEISGSTPPVSDRVTEPSTDPTKVFNSSTPAVTSTAGGATNISGTRKNESDSYGEATTESSTVGHVFSTLTTLFPTVISSTSEVDPSLTDMPPLITKVFLSTPPVTITERPKITEEETFKATASITTTTTTITTTSTTPPLPATSSVGLSSPTSTSVSELHTDSTTPNTTPSTTASTLELQTSSVHSNQSMPTLQTQEPSTGVASPTDVTTLQIETTSTGSLKVTTAHSHYITTTYTHRPPTTITEAMATTVKQTDWGTTDLVMTTSPTDIQPTKAPTPTSPPSSNTDDCGKNSCPPGFTHVKTIGSLLCDCPFSHNHEDGRTCTRAKKFLGTFISNKSNDLNPTMKLLNASLSVLQGYRGSILCKKEEDKVSILAVNIFSISSNVTSDVVNNSIQMSLKSCTSFSSSAYGCSLSYHVESLCLAQKTRCDTARSVCIDNSGTANCQCLQGYYKHNPDDLSCLECGDGYKLENDTCVPCSFGFGGFNCGNFYKLIAVIVSPAGGVVVLILIVVLIVTCCKKDKNDINKIIFKSGDLQMSPYADFPKNSRISMEWGRETIEMQENGSTKNLLQMTDIYYSPALRNSDLERNGLHPFMGLPGSRHSCIYPAQWNPSFINDDTRRRDYF